ncbi:murein biosynthesis integral membrane protein MurJ [Yimella sp. cx-573]|nr:murein biosynthesis integral membrane protein MurJ [Yimella sp. cx-573]
MTTTASTEAPSGRSSILRSSAVMAAGTMVSRVLGLVRTILLTTILGATTGVGNAFATANTLPNMVFILLAGGVLNAVLVPQMARALKQEDGGKGYTDRLLTLAMSILLIVTVVFTIAAPLAYFTLDVSGATPTTLGIAFTYICLPQILFYGIYTLLGEALNARGRFGAFMWSPVLANVVSIAGLIWFWMGTTPAEVADPDRWTWKMVAVLAGSATLGIVAQALVLIIPLRRAGYTFRPNFRFRGVGLRTASTVAIWAFAAVIVQQLGLIVTTNVLNAVPSGYGGTLAQQNAFLLFMLPHSIVTISLVTALYTRLSHAAADGRTDDVKADLDTGLRLSGLASVGVTIGAFALAHPVSKAMFGEVSGPAIGDMTIALMIGLVPFTICVLVQRVFYAYSDAKTPFWMQVACTVVAVVLTLGALILPPRWIGPGVGFAASMSYIADGALGWYLLRRRIGHIPVRSAARGYVQLGVAALVATIFAAAIRFGLQSVIGDTGRLVNMVITVAAGVPFLIVYMLVARRLGVQEITQLLNPVLSRLPGGRRKAAAPAAPAASAQPVAGAAPDASRAEVSREPEPLDFPDLPSFGVAEPGELAIGDPDQHAHAVRPVAPLPGHAHTAPPAFDFWDADHTMAVPSLGEGVLADTAPLPLRVRLPQSRRAVTMPAPPDAAPESRRVPDDSTQNPRLAPGADEEASAPETVGPAPTTTEGEPFVQGIESGHELAGRYLLRQLIASTDDKQVWQATDETLSRDVTATVFPTSATHAAAALDSARRAAAVEDRHLPRVLDVGTQDDASYVIHEQLTGAESIASMLQFDRLPAEEARRMVGEAASALHAAAARGLHHLALTPHEIVRGQDGSVYVQGVATDAALAGTDDLSSAEASRADARALTAVLYAALTGRWAGEQDVPGVEPAARDAAGNVSPVSSLRRNAPGDLSSLCHAVLNEDAGPRTPGELAAQLAPWSPEQVAADAPPTPEKPGSKTDDLGGTAAAAAAAGPAGVATAAPLRGDDEPRDVDPDATEHIPAPPPSDPDATQTFDATAAPSAPRRRDDYDPSFSELEPPLPRMSAGSEDPDSDTSKLALAIVAAFLVAALVLGIIGLRGLFTGGGTDSGTSRSTVATRAGDPSRPSGSTASPSSSTVAPGQKLPVASIVSFDPQGDGDEHTDWAPRAIDGNPNTMWMTHIYGRADYMGGRKKGSGLLLDLGKSTQVGSVKINSAGNPSTIQVFVTDDKTIEGATPFGEMVQQSGEQTVTAKAPATGRYVILWVTQLSKGNLGGYRQKIAEVEVLS